MVSHSPAKSTRSSKQLRQSTRPRCTPAKFQEVPPTPTKKETAEARKKAAAAAKKKKAAAAAKKKKAAAATKKADATTKRKETAAVTKAATAAKKKKKEAGGGKKKAKNKAGNKLPAAEEGSADVIVGNPKKKVKGKTTRDKDQKRTSRTQLTSSAPTKKARKAEEAAALQAVIQGNKEKSPVTPPPSRNTYSSRTPRASPQKPTADDAVLTPQKVDGRKKKADPVYSAEDPPPIFSFLIPQEEEVDSIKCLMKLLLDTGESDDDEDGQKAARPCANVLQRRTSCHTYPSRRWAIQTSTGTTHWRIKSE